MNLRSVFSSLTLREKLRNCQKNMQTVGSKSRLFGEHKMLLANWKAVAKEMK